MLLEIDLSSETPINIQLMYQIKKGVVKDELQPEENLPSVRVLTGDLGVNMHTINKAYNLLTEERVLNKNQKGYFLLPIHLRIQTKESKFLMKERMKELMIDALVYDYSKEELENWKKDIMKELEKREQDMWSFTFLMFCIFLILGVSSGIMPLFSRSSAPFSVSLPKEFLQDFFIEKRKTKYAIWNIGMSVAAGIPLFIIPLMESVNEERLVSIYTVAGTLFLVAFSFILYLKYRQEILIWKKALP